MTSRERWTVYPLLFLTLGITLKDKVTKEITTERVNCRSMYVTDREGKLQISLASTPAGGLLRVPTPGGPLWMLGNTGSLSGLMFVDARGKIVPIAVRSQPLRSNQPRATQPSPESEDVAPQDRPTETEAQPAGEESPSTDETAPSNR